MRKKIEEKKWRDILADISENVTEVSYRSWFTPLVPMEIDEDAGRTERVLLEEILEEQRMITGYTGNYIKVYVPYEDLEAAKGMLNQFVSVELSAAYRDGMRGRMV